MLSTAKNIALGMARSTGLLRLAGASGWRSRRLLVLCYHGVSLADEHHWNPSLYLTADLFRRRLEALRRSGCTVLPLEEGLQRLAAGTLPRLATAITFDDGFYDFYVNAYPALREYGFPATVYLTTYYAEQPYPIFNLICSYLFWKARGRKVPAALFELEGELDLATPASRLAALTRVNQALLERNWTAAHKNEAARTLAAHLGIDYGSILEQRLLQLMRPDEVREISRGGIDIQLHTHRHRTPLDETLFRAEIRDNRQRLRDWLGIEARHFCYPSGVHREAFLPWLAAENVQSATTCEYGLASRSDEMLLLPRVLDNMQMSSLDFEAWISGAGHWLPRRKV